MLPDSGHLAYVVVPKPVLWSSPGVAGIGAALLWLGASADAPAIGLPGLVLLLGAIPMGIFVLLRRRRRRWAVSIWPMVLGIALGVLLPPLGLYYWVART